MAVMAGLGILAAAVVVIATRTSGDHASGSSMDAVRTAGDIVRLRIDGSDSAVKRRALKTAAGKLKPSSLRKVLIAFASGDLEAAAREPADSPFARCLRGWVLFELGRRREASEELTRGLKESPPDWEYRTLFEEALTKTR